ncbi:MAG TPA: 1,4-dihydroxy-2-naphthoate polyprenyltransferase [Acidimicrobiia bacterium]|nr:1,4-dihydroxy-2-naphthoate polyprenyltransferase [Acidimicrobiia bacterium]
MTTTVGHPSGLGRWVLGARPRTLGAALAPVLVGTATAAAEAGRVLVDRAVLAAVVALALQVGVNYANDYSDGIRGTDTNRVGPLRLTASGLASPRAVRRAALIAFTVAAVSGLILSLLANPWLLVAGAAAIAAAALYTGGPKPYGYLGLGELMVLVFFGFVATTGSAYVQLGRIPASAWYASVAVGALACALLVVNNVRDRATDDATGKRTLAVRFGDRAGRRLYVACLVASFAGVAGIATIHAWAALGFLAAPFAWRPARLVVGGAAGPALIPALVATVRLELVVAALVAVGLWIS